MPSSLFDGTDGDTGSAIVLPNVPAMVVTPEGPAALTPDGEMIEPGNKKAIGVQVRRAPVVCHGPSTAARMGRKPFACHDILELFAFVCPARFVVPTVTGLAGYFNIPAPATIEQELLTLMGVARKLLQKLCELPVNARAPAKRLALTMYHGGWLWGEYVLQALGEDPLQQAHKAGTFGGLRVWSQLPEWSEFAPEPAPGNVPVVPKAARARLAELLGVATDKDKAAFLTEDRPEQADYASAMCHAFNPREIENLPNVVLAEAGTGVGKTLGYIAPASLWSEFNGAAVWISTFTRNLQRQLDGELSRLCPDKKEKRRRVVIRKGRENYMCLLNFEEACLRVRTNAPALTVPLGLLARWVEATRDGDMVGGDLPGWLVDLLGRSRVMALADHRGECIYSACDHYKRCFVERTIRRAKKADIVVANHALVMVQAALGGIDDDARPARYVFDEGHHLFHAADSAFSAHLSAVETADLRRWLRGHEEGGRGSRAKGLKRRAEEVVAMFDGLGGHLSAALNAAMALPAPGYPQRLSGEGAAGETEVFLSYVRAQVYRYAKNTNSPYGLECATLPMVDGLDKAAQNLLISLSDIAAPLTRFVKQLQNILNEQAATLETADKLKVESLMRSTERRALAPLSAWRDMLVALTEPPPAEFVDWFAVDRIDGRDIDVGLHRHWLDPTKPFADTFKQTAHGLAITSATLRDRTSQREQDWRVAEHRTGTTHFTDDTGRSPVVRAAISSPFDYGEQTRLIVVGDVNRNDPAQVAAAYRELFMASGGGALGVFTAISRLRKACASIREPLGKAGLNLLAQHVDALDTTTLIDIFKAEQNSCLLGTDAVRDGVDVPGRSLRLIVFDRVPWPRPDILHKARKNAFGGTAYDDMITRLKLSQAFGRLVRRRDDKGVFVMLDSRLPTRLCSAFPEDVEINRVGLKEAIDITTGFLNTPEQEE